MLVRGLHQTLSSLTVLCFPSAIHAVVLTGLVPSPSPTVIASGTTSPIAGSPLFKPLSVASSGSVTTPSDLAAVFVADLSASGVTSGTVAGAAKVSLSLLSSSVADLACLEGRRKTEPRLNRLLVDGLPESSDLPLSALASLVALLVVAVSFFASFFAESSGETGSPLNPSTVLSSALLTSLFGSLAVVAAAAGTTSLSFFSVFGDLADLSKMPRMDRRLDFVRSVPSLVLSFSGALSDFLCSAAVVVPFHIS